MHHRTQADGDSANQSAPADNKQTRLSTLRASENMVEEDERGEEAGFGLDI